MEGTRTASFARAIDGGSFVTSDGAEVKLAGILAPGKDGANTPAEARAATDALASALKTGPVTLAEAAGKDRYGRIVAQVFANSMWIQDVLLRAGSVRAAPDAASESCGKQMLAAESASREASAGAWGRRVFSVSDANSIGARTGTFQIVEGTVTTATLNRGRAYVNFGTDYRKDFTVTIAQGDTRAFRAARIDVRKLAGKRVRVRGWLTFYNGPEMEISSPAAIEILDTETKTAAAEPVNPEYYPKKQRRRRAD